MYRSPCLSRQQGKDRAFLRLGKHIPSGALAQSCRLPADATGGVFSPCRLLVTLDRQPEPEVLMASSALSIKEDILAALKDILMRHLPAPEIRPSPIDGLVLVRREDPPASDRCFEKPLTAIIVQGSKRSLIGSQEFVFRRGQFLVSGIDMPSSSSFSIRLPDSLSSPSSSIWTGRS